MSFDDATRAQIEAARPDVSTWLGANAGSGKTRVLTDRVARLLFSGVSPQHILCLTYTKAAASEMQNRLFKRLGAWAMLEDTALRSALHELGITGELNGEDLRRARTLFALAIETPGGLKIQTIHSFCAALLRRFPLEAGVSPQFTEIEERAADLLRAEIVDEMADGPDAAAVRGIAEIFSGEDFIRLTGKIVGMRDLFDREVTRADVLRLLEQPETLDAGQIERAVFTGGEAELLADILPHMHKKGGNDGKAAAKLQPVRQYDIRGLPTFEDVFLTGSGAKEPFSAKIGSLPTLATQKNIGPALEPFNAFMSRVEAAREARVALAAAEKTDALHQFARVFLDRYAQAKEQRGWLDFDDLILKTRALLGSRDVAAWVLYRIDGGINHILVDEAQDTSPRQWDIISHLTGEFFSGDGARANTDRTIFVVGDKKQSIYSFQGADPREFDLKRDAFRERVEGAGKPFSQSSLDYSFRSSSAILRLVDTVFDPAQRPGFDKTTNHLAFKETLPGRVDLWPLEEKAERPEKPHWTDPLDRRSEQHHDIILAERIADRIRGMINPADPAYIPDEDPETRELLRRPVRAGDFLILVQRRSPLFSEIIRACKAANLPIAGADRLKVGAELAVKDLAALLSFLAMPDDSLSLATALRSPLFGWSEQALFTLAHHRETTHLWEALRRDPETYPETLSILRDLRAQTDFLRPYDLIERILTRHDGRRKLLSRLGAEAEDGINAMLSQALSYERSDVPSLTGFIEWMRTDDLEIKRQIDGASDQIRVMTVHGAKGLEAPIVILPDTAKRDIRISDEIIEMQGMPVWKPSAAEMPRSIAHRRDGMQASEEAERLRLLYVAMTRAEKWLIVAAAGERKENSAWYDIIEHAMDALNAVPIDGEGTRRFEEGDWDGLPKRSEPVKPEKTPVLEPVFEESLPVFCHPPAILSPSDLGGPKALPGDAGEDTETAMRFGSAVHDLLETLPGHDPAEWHSAAQRRLSALPPEEIARAVSEAEGIIGTPDLAPIFAPGTLAEVPLTGEIAGQRLHGIIDRLVIAPDRVLLIDYKTNRVVPAAPTACPEGILRQMGAYARMLEQLYPDRRVDTAVLWTATATLMPLPHDLVMDALRRSPYLDGAGGRS